MNDKGMVYVFSGDGKGKTSAALGVTVRMLMINKRVVWISWYKCSEWQVSEMTLQNKFPGLLKMYWMGKGFYFNNLKIVKNYPKEVIPNLNTVVDKNTKFAHVQASKIALEKAESTLCSGRPPDLLVMDEVINAVSDGLLDERDVIRVIRKRGRTHVVLTGRGVTEKMIKEADLVTTMQKEKHPYDKGMMAVKGLDY